LRNPVGAETTAVSIFSRTPRLHAQRKLAIDEPGWANALASTVDAAPSAAIIPIFGRRGDGWTCISAASCVRATGGNAPSNHRPSHAGETLQEFPTIPGSQSLAQPIERSVVHRTPFRPLSTRRFGRCWISPLAHLNDAGLPCTSSKGRVLRVVLQVDTFPVPGLP